MSSFFPTISFNAVNISYVTNVANVITISMIRKYHSAWKPITIITIMTFTLIRTFRWFTNCTASPKTNAVQSLSWSVDTIGMYTAFIIIVQIHVSRVLAWVSFFCHKILHWLVSAIWRSLWNPAWTFIVVDAIDSTSKWMTFFFVICYIGIRPLLWSRHLMLLSQVFKENCTRTPTQTIKSGFPALSSNEIGSSLVSFEVIFEALKSELVI